jgi:hypothetical protein
VAAWELQTNAHEAELIARWRFVLLAWQNEESFKAKKLEASVGGQVGGTRPCCHVSWEAKERVPEPE